MRRTKEIKSVDNNIILRPFMPSDAEVLVILANNKNISINLRDGFPHPYSLKDARIFIKKCLKDNKQSIFAIQYKGVLVGSIGLYKQEDVYQLSAELGYFVGEAYWNKGIATKSIGLITKYGFENLHLNRIFAGVFQNNKASMLILEKNDFLLEGIKRKAIIKENQIMDEYLFAKLYD